MIKIEYYTAAWCGPCKAFSPVWDNFVSKNPQIAFEKIDVDLNRDKIMQKSIQSVPTLLFYKNGELKKIHTGTLTEHNLQNLVNQI